MGESFAVTVHGPRGAVDLVVPSEASVLDVAREYARQARLVGAPDLGDRRGQVLAPAASLAAAGIVPGDLLVVLDSDAPAARSSDVAEADRQPPSGLATLWAAVAAAAAVLAGWAAAPLDGTDGDLVVAVLAAAAVIGVLPLGRYAAHRVVAAPAFAGAAAYVVAWAPEPERLPTILGVAALTAGVAAAVARSLDRRQEEALRVWLVVGSAVFGVATLAALAGLPDRFVWGVLLLLAVLAPRFVPGVAVDVPDQLLIDLERLAVTAWSARERPTGRRGRTIVPETAVAAVAARGSRTVIAASAAVLAVAALSAPLLLAAASEQVDLVGARVLVGLGGATLLLSARSYRNTTARALLRLAGLVCWAALLVSLAPALVASAGITLAAASVALAVLVLIAAVATGRGWRSASWSRRAEVAEAIAGSVALASLVVAVGFFRHLWESIPDV
ncbi:MAG: hypothetical protein F2667_06055 [Actinobacteria bacterium]|uniref:Unannotated protein n=1 Tax=freshwater metagenome TaxID=449393 RepID=A0A6J6QB48_9ZZZZ|nr:hypothetical protein [Actinomycetota bacterium]